MRFVLIVVGVTLETIGITLLALDLLADPLTAGRDRVTTAAHNAASQAHAFVRKLRRKTGTVFHKAGTATATASGGAVIAVVKIPGPESPDLVRWLRDQTVANTTRIRELEDITNADRAHTTNELRQLGDSLRVELATKIAESRHTHRGWRLTGFGIAIAGIFIALIGSMMAP